MVATHVLTAAVATSGATAMQPTRKTATSQQFAQSLCNKLFMISTTEKDK
jgi:hypothetical protein